MQTQTDPHRDDHMLSAGETAKRICDDAKLRGLTGYDVAVSFALVAAARAPDLAGDILMAVEAAIRQHPATVILRADGEAVPNKPCDTCCCTARCDGSDGQTNRI